MHYAHFRSKVEFSECQIFVEVFRSILSKAVKKEIFRMKSVLGIILLIVLTEAYKYFLPREKCLRIVCYFVREVTSTFSPNSVDASLCTHIVVTGFSITRSYHLNTIYSYSQTDPVPDLVKLKEEHPHLKILISIQNDEFFDGFVAMYSSPQSRKIFIYNIIYLLREKNLDGVKIDQQLYQGSKGNFSDFITDLQCAFLKEAHEKKKTKLILSVGIPVNNSILMGSYDIEKISEYSDMLDVASYYFKVENVSNNPEYHSPSRSKDPTSTRSTEYVLHYMLSKNVERHKVNVGLSLLSFAYFLDKGGSYYLHNINNYGWYCLNHTLEYSPRHIWRNVYPENDFLVERFFNAKKNKFEVKVFYDEHHNLAEKVKYTLSYDFGGVAVKALEYDEYSHGYCKRGELYPLMKAINRACGLL
ncbi:hypothetical protein Btru_043288 [Bulinus truncatus]|nr:hypothetical protein Btru_043288 [Bulinus truncatus]